MKTKIIGRTLGATALLMVLLAGDSHADGTMPRDTFIRECARIAVDELASKSLRVSCMAANPSEQLSLDSLKLDLSDLDLARAAVGTETYQGKDYHLQVAIRLSGLFLNTKVFQINCRQDAFKPDSVILDGYAPIFLKERNLWDRAQGFRLKCRGLD